MSDVDPGWFGDYIKRKEFMVNKKTEEEERNLIEEMRDPF